mmetsp:Transcript_127738/g.272417  ORF Transcript_127738/g.272417 Transcript_127738/m.272417 type:complete len:300 (-) Transcript_127738:224-1123(-)
MSWVAVDQQLVGAATWAEKLVELIEHHKGKQRPEDETGGEYVPDHAVCTHPELHRQPKATGTTKASRPQHALPQGHAQHEEAPLEDEPREEGVLPAHPPKVAQGDDGLDYVEAEYHDGGKGERDPQAATEASPYLFAHARRFAPRRRCWRHSMVLCRGVGLFLLILLLLLVLVAFHGLLLLLLLLLALAFPALLLIAGCDLLHQARRAPGPKSRWAPGSTRKADCGEAVQAKRRRPGALRPAQAATQDAGAPHQGLGEHRQHTIADRGTQGRQERLDVEAIHIGELGVGLLQSLDLDVD